MFDVEDGFGVFVMVDVAISEQPNTVVVAGGGCSSCRERVKA